MRLGNARARLDKKAEAGLPHSKKIAILTEEYCSNNYIEVKEKFCEAVEMWASQEASPLPLPLR